MLLAAEAKIKDLLAFGFMDPPPQEHGVILKGIQGLKMNVHIGSRSVHLHVLLHAALPKYFLHRPVPYTLPAVLPLRYGRHRWPSQGWGARAAG